MAFSAPVIFEGEAISFARSSGLNSNSGKHIAKLYLDSGLLRTGVDALGLEKSDRFEALILELQGDWTLANRVINGARLAPNTNAGGPIITAGNLEILIYGRGVSDSDNISGKAMLQAIRHMSVLVVDWVSTVLPAPFALAGNGALHSHVVVAMFVEAIGALQHDKQSIFRSALLSKSLKKVTVYTKVEQQHGETTMQFELRKAQDKLSKSEAERLRMEKNLKHEILKLQFNQKDDDSPRHNENVPSAPPLARRDYESDDRFQVRTLQKDLAELKVDHEKQRRENRQLKMDLDHEKELLRVSDYEYGWKDGVILRLKEKLKNKNLQHKKDKLDLQLSLELSELKLENSERIVKKLAKKMRARVRLMGKNVELKHKLAK